MKAPSSTLTVLAEHDIRTADAIAVLEEGDALLAAEMVDQGLETSTLAGAIRATVP